MFQRHLERLRPVADAGNDVAKHAMATIYLLELIYPDEATREERFPVDRATMTQLLCDCAENGMEAAFDNLVTSGTGEIGDSARAAAKEHELARKPDWHESSNLPLYSPEWMSGALNLWRSRRCKPGGSSPAEPREPD